MIKRLFLLFLVLTVSVGFAGVPTLNTGIDRGAARTDASNVTATQSWRDTIDVYSKPEVAAAIATESLNRDAAIATDALNWAAAVATETSARQAHEASTTTAVHGLGTMSGETATNYVGSAGANISGAAFRAALGVYSSAELATYSAATSADLTGSNITATTTFLAAIGGAKLNGDLGQPFQSEDMTVSGSFTHNLASGGYVVYQGNTKSSAAGQASIDLPLDWPWEQIVPASGTCGYIKADVIGKREADLAVSVIHFQGDFHKFNNILTIVGSIASTTSSVNASDMKAELRVVAGSDWRITATSTPGTIWQVKKLEIGGL